MPAIGHPNLVDRYSFLQFCRFNSTTDALESMPIHESTDPDWWIGTALLGRGKVRNTICSRLYLFEIQTASVSLSPPRSAPVDLWRHILSPKLRLYLNSYGRSNTCHVCCIAKGRAKESCNKRHAQQVIRLSIYHSVCEGEDIPLFYTPK